MPTYRTEAVTGSRNSTYPSARALPIDWVRHLIQLIRELMSVQIEVIVAGWG